MGEGEEGIEANSMKFSEMMTLCCTRTGLWKDRIRNCRLWNRKSGKLHFSGTVVLSDIKMHLNSPTVRF